MVKNPSPSEIIKETLNGLADRKEAVELYKAVAKKSNISRREIIDITKIGSSAFKRYVDEFVSCFVINKERTNPVRYSICDSKFADYFKSIISAS